MLFNSWLFAAYFPVVFCLYWFVFNRQVKLQNAFLATASFVFYGWWDVKFLLLLFLSLFVDFFIGWFLQKSNDEIQRKWLIRFSILFNVGLLAVFKYFNFFIESFKECLLLFNYKADFVTLNILLPVGISFYTFQSLSYTIQVYRRKMEATNDIVSYAAYISFFPQLVAGPIEKASHFLPQFFKERKFNYAETVKGLRLVLWGMFKKVVIADTCAFYANLTFGNFQQYDGLILIMGVVYFAFQIYCDFSGYTDIARGLAKLLGFDLIVNFRYPYFSRNIAEFWKRWHISLSTWFRDYLYIPLGGSYGSKSTTIRNTLIVFLVSGFWHGANLTFIVWGALHGLYYLPHVIFNNKKQTTATVAEGRWLPNIKEGFAMIFTFVLVCIAWVFFRIDTVKHGFQYLFKMTQVHKFSLLGKSDALWLILLLIIIDWLGRNNDNTLDALVNKAPKLRYAVYLALGVFILANFSKQTSFIYFQF